MILSLLLALSSVADPGCREVDEDGLLLCPARLPGRAWVSVDRTGIEAWRETVTRPDCSRFRPTVAAVKRYLARAERTTRSSVHAALPESPCYATGRIGFADGRVASYRVDQYRIMWMRLPREAEEVILYCEVCRFGGFEE